MTGSRKMEPAPVIQPKRRFRRIAFRSARIAFLFLLLAFTGLLLWCNYVGVPSLITSAVKQELRRKNLALDFSHLRLKGFRRLVANDVEFTSAASTNTPTVTIREAELLLDYRRMAAGEIDLDGLRVTSATVVIPLPHRGKRRILQITNIQSELRFLQDDTVRLIDFSADTLGTTAAAAGELRNFSRFTFSGPASDAPPSRWQTQLAETVEIIEQFKFRSPPRLNLKFVADAADLTRSKASLALDAQQAESQWGTLESLRLASEVSPTQSNSAIRAVFQFTLRGLRSPNARLDSFSLSAESVWSTNMARLVTNSVSAAAKNLHTEWAQAAIATANLSSGQQSGEAEIVSALAATVLDLRVGDTIFGTNQFAASLSHALPFPSPAVSLGKFLGASSSNAPPQTVDLKGQWHFDSTGLRSPRASVESIFLTGNVRTNSAANTVSPSAGLWRSLGPLELPVQLVVRNVFAEEINIGSLRADALWNYPMLEIQSLEADLYGGSLKGAAALDVDTRTVTASANGDFDYHKVALLLERPVQRWLAQFGWEAPPRVNAALRFQLPAWTNVWGNLDRKILPTLEITGQLEGGGSFRGVRIQHAASDFHFTNFVWHLPNLTLTQPEGRALLDYTGNVSNSEFLCTFDSRIDPAVLKPLFPKEQQLPFEILKFAQPPRIRGETWGNWAHDERLGFAATFDATNFFVREQSFSDIRGDLSFTNLVLECRDLLAHRGAESVRAPYLRIDMTNEVMFVTNAVSTIDPWVAMSLVGEDAYEAIDPYRFASTPTVKINGNVPLRHYSKADLHFEVAGKDFTFWKFNLPTLTGEVYWKGDHLSFSNVSATFYSGRARWSGYFFINDEKSADFSFKGITTNSDLNLLVSDLIGTTNHLEGFLDGELIITSANSDDPTSWNGYGRATLRDGFLWNVPVFGIFSPVLDSLLPVGASRVTSGTGAFAVTNSVVYTRDMQVRAPAFRLNYKGQVDLEGVLDARVEAEIFRDIWLIGKLFSIALWPVSKAFEARVSGTLTEPKTDLRYLPNPFRAFGAGADAAPVKPPSGRNLEPSTSSAPPIGVETK